ncbi:MAG: choice-of-anchor D domain-containing protein, partial [Kiritimatiellota bacterium]|nr:choice-of-anchor D domain-containing protein [Kiritimatiellota bacterium]
MYLTTFSGNTADAHRDVFGVPTILGTNGATIGNAEPASAAKGTDFGSVPLGQALTNVLAITNGCTNAVTISGVTTSGAGAAAFSISDLQFSIEAGGVSNFTVQFAPINAGAYTAAVHIVNDSATTPYIVYLTGTLNPAPVQDGWLAINVTPETGSWFLTAPAGYIGPTSGTGNLAAVSAVTGLYSLAWGALSGYVAPSNQYGFVTGGSTTLFSGVYLQVSTNIGTPSGVSATEGTYTNKIRIFWQGVAGATGYQVWRSQTNDANTAIRIAEIPLITLRRITDDLKGRAKPPAEPQNDERLTGDGSPYLQDTSKTVYYYDDYNVNPVYAYYYWVRAKTATLISPMSYVGMGYAALASDQKTGTADIAVSDFVFLPVNVTNNSL